MKISRNY